METEHTEPESLTQGKNGKGNDGWMASLEFILQTALKDKEPGNIALAMEKVSKHLMQSGLTLPPLVRTPYTNTIAPEDEPPYPGNREIERRINQPPMQTH